MIHHQVVIVGGGPAGAVCAGRLVKNGVDCIILDKQEFPRSKTCAGWITPQVFQDLNINPEEYPHQLTSFSSLKIYLNGFPLSKPGKQYAIRRLEFDHWLLKFSRASVIHHEVKDIQKTKNGYLIDNQFTADIVIGAGGTHCPVYHQFFKADQPRVGEKIVALEEEYPADWQDGTCRLWFFENDLPGYAWYVPKEGGFVNLGVGGNDRVLREKGSNIQKQWTYFVNKLIRMELVENRQFNPEGYVYYLRSPQECFEKDNIYLVGDAAGLATLDMGEGIGPAIRSGLMLAESILNNTKYSTAEIERFSLLPVYLRWIIS